MALPEAASRVTRSSSRRQRAPPSEAPVLLSSSARSLVVSRDHILETDSQAACLSAAGNAACITRDRIVVTE
jgi:hypothetical protein